jgi:hypothetical protein
MLEGCIKSSDFAIGFLAEEDGRLREKTKTYEIEIERRPRMFLNDHLPVSINAKFTTANSSYPWFSGEFFSYVIKKYVSSELR